MTKQFLSAITKADGRTVEFVASHQLVDRDGDVVLVEGIDWSEFWRNPVMLGQHAHREPAVATAAQLWRGMLMGVPALFGRTAVFPDRPQSNSMLADIQAGVVNGISIGFLSLETGPPILPGQFGVTHTKTRLLEISFVTLPSCPTCTVIAKSAKRSSSCSCGGLTQDNAVLDIDEDVLDVVGAENLIEVDPTHLRRLIADNLAKALTTTVINAVRDEIDYQNGVVR